MSAPIRGILAHAEVVDATRVQRRASPLAVNPAPLYFTEVSQQVRQGDVGPRGEPLDTDEQLGVGDRCERVGWRHDSSYTRDSASPTLREARVSPPRTRAATK